MKRAFASMALSALLVGSSVNAYAATPGYTPGVTVTANENSKTGYTATFVYRADPTVTRVMLYSDTFMLWDEQAPQYTGGSNGMNLNNLSPDFKAAYGHLPGDYKTTYWPGGGSGSSRYAVELTKVAGTEDWVTTADLSSGAFVYNFEITKNGITTARLDDPANPALVNTATGLRSLSSLVYVPYNAAKQGTGEYRDRSLELPRTDGKTGVVQTITYPASNGTDRGMTVYLPYGYDAKRATPYNVLYINMGNSGDQFGNEMRWMNEGALPKIVDNLVQQGHEPFVAVSVNYQDWGHSFARIEPDVLNYILPFIESRYNVSKNRAGRGYAGLSAGAGTTANFYLNHPDVFSQFGIWSNGITPNAQQIDLISQYKATTNVHIGLGKWDYVFGGRAMHSTLAANGIRHEFTEIPGGHDWEFWQLMFAKFAKEYLWKLPSCTSPSDPSLVNGACTPELTLNVLPSALNLRTTTGVVQVVIGAASGYSLSGWTVRDVKLSGVSPVSLARSANGATYVATFNKATLSGLPSGSNVPVNATATLAGSGNFGLVQASTTVTVIR
ncbi:alpha/beta hydrolase [Variovorax sp. HJSM1_2]|uniref:alpha/beta hydrolase n=1 Tax=Variovorax sp. HJSM1_2 TaxID=3366263 RepID=UPI003BED70C5